LSDCFWTHSPTAALVQLESVERNYVAYSHYVRCPRCAQLYAVENRTPLWVLALGRCHLRLNCSHCGFRRSYFFMSAARFETIAVDEEVVTRELDSRVP
jgi:hypothetical protein